MCAYRCLGTKKFKKKQRKRNGNKLKAVESNCGSSGDGWCDMFQSKLQRELTPDEPRAEKLGGGLWSGASDCWKGVEVNLSTAGEGMVAVATMVSY